MRSKLTQDQLDFIEVAKEESLLYLADWVKFKLERGLHPKEVATILTAHADRLRGWCNGRYGAN